MLLISKMIGWIFFPVVAVVGGTETKDQDQRPRAKDREIERVSERERERERCGLVSYL